MSLGNLAADQYGTLYCIVGVMVRMQLPEALEGIGLLLLNSRYFGGEFVEGQTA